MQRYELGKRYIELEVDTKGGKAGLSIVNATYFCGGGGLLKVLLFKLWNAKGAFRLLLFVYWFLFLLAWHTIIVQDGQGGVALSA